MRIGKYLSAATLVVAIIAAPIEARAQTRKKTKPPRKSEPTLAEKLAEANAQVVAASTDYKAKLGTVLELQERDVQALAETLEKRKALFEDNIISKKEVDDAEQALALARSKVVDTQKLMTEADNLIAEAKAEDQLAKLGPSRIGSYQATGTLIRYNGTARWRWPMW
jgi:multidrug resistance efflux pump